jgi:hypothetical protein
MLLFIGNKQRWAGYLSLSFSFLFRPVWRDRTKKRAIDICQRRRSISATKPNTYHYGERVHIFLFHRINSINSIG